MDNNWRIVYLLFCLSIDSMDALPFYKIAVILEDGVLFSFDRPKAGPPTALGQQELKFSIDDKLIIKYIERYIQNKPLTCKIQGVGSLLADLYHIEKINAIIGPGCTLSLEIIGLMAASWKLPIITPVGSGGSLANKENYKTLTRLSSDNKALAKFIINVFRSFNWTDIAFIRHTTNVVMDLQENTFLPLFREAGITVTTVTYKSNYNHKAVLEKASRTARVFVISLYPDTLHDMLMAAQKLGMNDGDYAMIVLRQLNTYGRGDQLTPFKLYNNDPAYIKAYASVLVTDRRLPSGPMFDKFAATIMQMSKDQYNFTYGDTPFSRTIQEYYNAFLLMGNALNKTINEGKDPFDGMEVVKNMWNLSFHGVSRMIAIDGNGDRDDDFSLFDFQKNGEALEVAKYIGVEKKYMAIPRTIIHWPGNRGPPPNRPNCGYRGTALHCQTTDFPVIWIIAIAFCAILVTIACAGIVLYRKMKLESQIQSQWWKIKWEDVLIDTLSRNLSRSGLSCLQSQLLDTKSRRTQVFANIAVFKGTTVAIKKLKLTHLQLGRETLLELKQMRDVNCHNLTKFHGLCPDEPNICFLIEYCSRGSLEDILQNDSIQLDKHFKVSLINDIVQEFNPIYSSQKSGMTMNMNQRKKSK